MPEEPKRKPKRAPKAKAGPKGPQRKTPPKRAPAEAEGLMGRRTGEFIGIILMALALLAFAALCSLQFGTGRLMGPFGRMLALSLYAMLGLGSYLVVLAICFIGLRTLMGQGFSRWTTWAGYLGATLCGAILFHLMFPGYTVYGFTAGGKSGEILGELLVALFSSAGTYLVTSVGMLIFLLVATEASFVSAALGVGKSASSAGRSVGRGLGAMGNGLRRIFTWQTAEATQADGSMALPPPPGGFADGDDESGGTPLPAIIDHSDDNAIEKSDTGDVEVIKVGPTKKTPPRKKKKGEGPVIVESEFETRDEGSPMGTVVPLKEGGIALPELSMLDTPQHEGGKKLDHEGMHRLADRLGRALKNYGIQGDVTEIHPGPVVTLYEYKPAPGMKVARIASLDKDLAMTLEATSVRIVAPIPGKGTVGIEVPNKSRDMVYLQELLADKVFTDAKSLLTVGLGKDIAGKPTAMNLAKAPHLLVAGSTGSGKSVGINAMLMSLLYRARPDEVRLILIDPKMLEFSMYEGIPHLLLPVVTDPKKANQALRWAVNEMERRYQLLAGAGVRNVEGYNKKLKEQQELAEKVLAEVPDKAEEEAEDREPLPDEQVAAELAAREAHTGFEALMQPEPLPYIVIVIDEFADLMMVAAKDVEHSVARIAQKARAAGIHLIVATQRPSKDVITGLIKANFPSRLAFRVSSKIDSRVILDRNGAEALLGMGDMLHSNGQAPERMHGAFVSTAEIERVVAFLKEQARPVYNLDILKPDEEEEGSDLDDEETDALYDKAVELVTTNRRASTSWIQRQLRIGYNRAARILEMMERDGVVGAQESGARNREVLAPSPDYDD